jgi:hypothetical protein
LRNTGSAYSGLTPANFITLMIEGTIASVPPQGGRQHRCDSCVHRGRDRPRGDRCHVSVVEHTARLVACAPRELSPVDVDDDMVSSIGRDLLVLAARPRSGGGAPAGGETGAGRLISRLRAAAGAAGGERRSDDQIGIEADAASLCFFCGIYPLRLMLGQLLQVHAKVGRCCH